MLDIQFIRENAAQIKKAAKDKKLDPKVVDRLLKVDETRRQLIAEVEKLRQERNKLKKGEVKKGKEIKEVLRRLEPDLRAVDQEFQNLMLLIPIPGAKNVPLGKNEEDNKEVKRWGKAPKFSFKPKDYLSLMQDLDLLDLERGAKIGGFRQYLIKNEAVILEQALLRWSLDKLAKKGFTLFRPTSMVKETAKIGTGFFPFAKEDTYQVDKDLFLSGTTEVPLMNYYAGELLEERDLPIKSAGISVAFRKEVGSYGRDVKGVFRVHEFWQTEMIVLCKNSEKESLSWWEKLLKISEEMMQALAIPYRVVLVCTGDLAAGQVARYDIEAWVPSQKKYRETHSDSYLFDFQTRRLNIRYRDKKGEIHFAHSLNNTGLAVPRILIPLIENHQQKDGSVLVPKVLQKYTGFGKILPKT
jgi:seryl-tRNA synthetase